jgi:hypothetical protein
MAVLSIHERNTRGTVPISSMPPSDDITNSISTNGNGNNQADLYRSTGQACTQAVFELLDLLMRWLTRDDGQPRDPNDHPVVIAIRNRSLSSSPSLTDDTKSSDTRSKSKRSSSSSSSATSGRGSSDPIPTTTLSSDEIMMIVGAPRPLSERKEVLDSIPKPLLARASFGCAAYSRALKFFELHLREERIKYKEGQSPTVSSLIHHSYSVYMTLSC